MGDHYQPGLLQMHFSAWPWDNSGHTCIHFGISTGKLVLKVGDWDTGVKARAGIESADGQIISMKPPHSGSFAQAQWYWRRSLTPNHFSDDSADEIDSGPREQVFGSILRL